MIVSMENGATERQIKHVRDKIRQLGYKEFHVHGEEKTVIGVVGVGNPDDLSIALHLLELMPGVERVVRITTRYKLVSQQVKKAKSVITVNGGIGIGGKTLAVIAGPCSVEGRRMLRKIAGYVQANGANLVRGGAFKPRTSPYEFQGMEEEGLRLLREVYDEFGLPVVTEVMDPRDVELVSRYAHVLQIGARNMQNYPLLKEVGMSALPVLLKRGISATVEEWLQAAEWIAHKGNEKVILCERGIRTPTEVTRFTLDIGAIVAAQTLTHLPIIADISHAAGDRKFVSKMAAAAIACGADGIMVEVHNNPERALSDGKQSLTTQMFFEMMEMLSPYIRLWEDERNQ